jgi:hypothetical protein
LYIENPRKTAWLRDVGAIDLCEQPHQIDAGSIPHSATKSSPVMRLTPHRILVTTTTTNQTNIDFLYFFDENRIVFLIWR